MNILISSTSGEPIYAQIVGQIRQLILQGELVSGTPLPSIRLLAKELQISVITTKRAYEELEREGLVNSIVGKGSFVSGADQEFIREQRLRIVESRMKEIIEESKLLGIDFAEITEMMKLLYEEEDKE
ncbi:GntR family transcriptional regulator [Paenibacillus donghaensis]|uniref:GntR family transcriptional regulator n=1 Tax=Paenibacillus donghaensis TaxID=414771 RepID=A0A2Z2KRR1_9BACL|nr:GntR family transcriptional regulator [Paenibacillus donghaensis]ASA21698.1 GntR family transcriptional regulator [Paenibacillus donghaensis]